MRPVIYLDNSATTQLRKEVKEAMLPFLFEEFGNASSAHSVGRDARNAIEHSREQVAALIGAHTAEIYFSPSATYSNNAAILGRAAEVEKQGLGRHIITTKIEHSSSLLPAKSLAARGWNVTILDVDKQGFVNIEQLKSAITDDTSIISVMWANNEIGTIQPVKEIGAIAREHGIFFHCDAVQVPGKIAIDVEQIGADTLSLSGHKFHGPKGIGVLYVRNGVTLAPLTFGGGQENGLFPGTEGLANIVGIGKAAELAKSELNVTRKALKLYQAVLIDKLLKYPGVRLTGAKTFDNRLPGHVSIVVPGIDGSELVLDADVRHLCISSASACSAGKKATSHVLSAIGEDENSVGALRITAGTLNTREECERAGDLLNDLISSATYVPANAANTKVARLHSAPIEFRAAGRTRHANAQI